MRISLHATGESFEPSIYEERGTGKHPFQTYDVIGFGSIKIFASRAQTTALAAVLMEFLTRQPNSVDEPGTPRTPFSEK